MKVFRLLVPGYDPVDFDNFADATTVALGRADDGAIVRVQTLEKLTSFKLLNTVSITTRQEG